MLKEVLNLIDQGQTLAMTEMAQKLGWTIQKVQNSLDQLERMGYIEKKDLAFTSCSTESCSSCLFKQGDSCQKYKTSLENLYSWSVTERGKDAL
ncbi:winged helix-turn-helix transcriptional regulator [Desulfitobacterium sp. AusDCA]|uniref:winged helix-turn-helix transcriptional regulator n=1 Tax=Desulfitobacterium sp. AusDCA TaxID=3240383 RepID=UPI003DA6FB26